MQKAAAGSWCKLDEAASRLFPPQVEEAEAAREALLHLVRRDPRACGQQVTRWTLAAILASCPWLRLGSLGGMQQLLRRLRIVWKRGRSHVPSPDPDYAAKLADVAALRQRAAAAPSRYVLAYLDEATILRQPTVAMGYAAEGQEQPLAERSHCADTQTRVVATLDALTGRVVYRRAHRITLATLVQFYRDLRTAYPEAERIYVVQDNWPVHFHPDVLAALEPQQCRWPWPRPANWRTKARREATKNYGQLALPIQLVPLPTYASWANPIEKLWRKLRQDVTHHHPWADDLARLRSEIDTFLDQFAKGSPALLRYTGLWPG